MLHSLIEAILVLDELDGTCLTADDGRATCWVAQSERRVKNMAVSIKVRSLCMISCVDGCKTDMTRCPSIYNHPSTHVMST